MTLNHAYAEVVDLREKLSMTGTSTAANAQLEQLLNTSSRWVEKFCGRRFYGVPETRYYTADDNCQIEIDDLATLTALKTDDDGDGTFEHTWSTTDYHLKYGDNYNADLDGKPWTEIEISNNGQYTFPTAIKKGVLVQGVFGYVASTNALTGRPDPVHDATLLVAERLYKKKDAPFGVMGGNVALGQTPVSIKNLNADPEIRDLLMPLKRGVK